VVVRAGLRIREQRSELGLGAIAQRLEHFSGLLLELAGARRRLHLGLLERVLDLRLKVIHRGFSSVSHCVTH
jgi:hypothetical protein